MVKLRKEKILVSLVVITLVALVFGSVSSLATAPVITPTVTGGNTENTTGAVSSDTNSENTSANNTENSGTRCLSSPAAWPGEIPPAYPCKASWTGWLRGSRPADRKHPLPARAHQVHHRLEEIA